MQVVVFQEVILVCYVASYKCLLDVSPIQEEFHRSSMMYPFSCFVQNCPYLVIDIGKLEILSKQSSLHYLQIVAGFYAGEMVMVTEY